MAGRHLIPSPPASVREHFQGCLLGGAAGDALGAPVEFQSRAEILRNFGPSGLTQMAPCYDRLGALTDDTQMTLFTAEGLLRALVRGTLKGICDMPSVVHMAYFRWLSTQGEALPAGLDPATVLTGWLALAVTGICFVVALVFPCISRRLPGQPPPAEQSSQSQHDWRSRAGRPVPRRERSGTCAGGPAARKLMA